MKFNSLLSKYFVFHKTFRVLRICNETDVNVKLSAFTKLELESQERKYSLKFMILSDSL